MNIFISDEKLIIKRSSIIMLVFTSVIFPRVLSAVGAPSGINFAHFVFVPALFIWVIPIIRTQASTKILIGLLILLATVVSSALSNQAGLINVILSFLLLSEPFMFLAALTSVNFPSASLKLLQKITSLFVYIHLLFVYFQYFIIRTGDPDDVKGIFLGMGAGHHVGGDVALTFGVYFLIASGVRWMWLRVMVFSLCFANILFADVKQVVAVFLVSWTILIITQVKQIRKTLLYIVIAVPVIFLTLQLVLTLYGGIAYVSNTEVIKEALTYKFSVFSIISSFFKSPINWFVGLGPGHTISRLGWLMSDYIDILKPLGVSATSVFDKVWDAQQSYYWSHTKTGSSMYSLLFSWAGIWGDIGFFGLGAYLYLWLIVWKDICVDQLSKFFSITIFVSGFIFSWMEEPAFMLFVVNLIGLQWQKSKNSVKFHTNNSWEYKTNYYTSA